MRRHTIAFAPQLNRLYAFGLGAYGQLGHGRTDSCNSPVVALGQWMTSSLSNKTSVIKIVAGGNHCFVLSSKSSVSFDVFLNFFFSYFS